MPHASPAARSILLVDAAFESLLAILLTRGAADGLPAPVDAGRAVIAGRLLWPVAGVLAARAGAGRIRAAELRALATANATTAVALAAWLAVRAKAFSGRGAAGTAGTAVGLTALAIAQVAASRRAA